MPWTERQRAMLGAMGIAVWAPAAARRDENAGALAAPAPAESSKQPVQLDTRAARAAPLAGDARSTRDVEIAALDWPQLRERVAACRACRLCEGRTQTVFGVGNEQAHCMIVGEAPGENEDLQGEPFVGAAGQLLDRMLQAIGLTRASAEPAQQVYIANTLKCRPPRNRNPEPGEMQRCEPFLVRQIELIKPRLILAMGRFAVQSLLRSDEPVGRLRGRVHRYQGVPLVVTYHPAYLLRNPDDKARSWEDLCLARDVLARGAT